MFAFSRSASTLARQLRKTSKPRLEALEERTLLSFFADSFEAPTFNPFWTKSEQSGTITPSAGCAHTGNQCAKFTTTQTSQDKWLFLSHSFSPPAFGRVTVWMEDLGANVSSSNYAFLTLQNTSLQMISDIGVYDYDLGPGNGGDVYYYRNWVSTSQGPKSSGIDRTPTWHKWEITSLPNLHTVAVDGTVLFSGAGGVPFDTVHLAVFGPSWRPAFTYHFDDFEIRYRTFGAPMPSDDGAVDRLQSILSTAVSDLITSTLVVDSSGMATSEATAVASSTPESILATPVATTNQTQASSPIIAVRAKRLAAIAAVWQNPANADPLAHPLFA